MRFIPVSCANMMIIDGLSATTTDVRTSARLGSCEKAHWHPEGAGSAINGAGSILGPKPPEQRRRPIRGAGSNNILEPAPLTPGTCAENYGSFK